MTEYMNTDGSFGDMTGAPESVSSLVTNKGWANVEAMATGYQTEVAYKGTLKEKLNLPETLTDEMAHTMRGRLGRPETVEGYDFGDAGKTFKPDILNGIKELAHKQGLNPTQATAIVNQILEIANVEIADEQTRITAVETALKEKHGDKYDVYMEEALNVSDTLGITETLDKTGLNNNPEIIEMLHAMKAKLSEASLKAPGGSIADSNTVDAKIKVITESEAYTKKMHPDHHKMIGEVRELLAQKYNQAGRP